MASGQIVTKHYADGDVGIDIFIGPTQTTNPPFRVLDNAGNVIAFINPIGNFNAGQTLTKQQQPAVNVVMSSTDTNFFVNTAGGNILVEILNPGNAVQSGLLGRMSRTIRVVKTTQNANTVTVRVIAGGGINGAATDYVLSTYGQAIELISMPLGDATGTWWVNASSGSLDPIKTVSATPYVPIGEDRVLQIDATAGAFAVNLPLANSVVSVGHELLIKKIDASANAVTISRAGADTIEAGTTVVLAAQWNYTRLRSDSVTNWIIVV